jgi:ferredoxin
VKVVIDPNSVKVRVVAFPWRPGIFGFDDLGNGVVLGDGTLSPETLDLARLAQANCPEHAIFIEEDE